MLDSDEHPDCDDASDETESACQECAAVCKVEGRDRCIGKKALCDGVFNCDDGIDETPSLCDNCNWKDLTRCRDGSQCVKTEIVCSSIFGVHYCTDGSDKSDTWSNCTFCTGKGSVPCPGFPGNCAKVCDGVITCPDAWDELLSTCKAHKASCSEEAGLFQCTDGSNCLDSKQICNSVKDCEDWEDESAKQCKDKCESLRSLDLLSCDKAAELQADNLQMQSCIWKLSACIAQDRPLCQDGSDMDESLCKEKCYTSFPNIEDPYRVPCKFGAKKCILRTSRCDGNPDCDDGTGSDISWDEQGCPFFTQAGLIILILVCLAATVLCWPLFFFLSWCSDRIKQKTQLDFLTKANDDKTTSPPHCC